MTIPEIQTQIVSEFSAFQYWPDKYKQLAEYGKTLQQLPSNYYRDEYLVRGCTSKVWLVCSPALDGSLMFYADADAVIVKGLVAILLRCFCNQKPADILSADIQFFEAMGFSENLAPSRNNGIHSMWKKIREYAEKRSTQLF